jgi:3-(3-hydroxy-phenyl)propionate hydroxylase
MFKTYTHPTFDYVRSAEQASGSCRRHPVVVVGAGPVGLTQALDLAWRGIPVVVLDDNNTVSVGSRAVCYAKRTLEVWDRMDGLGAEFAGKGVQWKIGKTFFRDELAYQFDLLPESHHQLPAMINYQQYHLEERLVKACAESPLVDLRWKHRVVALAHTGTEGEAARLTVETPDGRFELEAQWVVAADGANSDTRRMLGLDFEGQVFQDRFLIADVVIEPLPAGHPATRSSSRGAQLLRADAVPERWFWFDPPFHRGQSVLLHKQCDKVWRIDFQLGRNADPTEEKKPENVIPRIQAMLGPDVPFELEWVSVYQFACRRMQSFRHGRVLFVGDAAHQVSPFGARGANSGVQDVDNLGWKLQAVLEGRATGRLLDSYSEERTFAADDNIGHSTRATDFITPKSDTSLTLRNAVLELARTEAFARPIVNSGRLSTHTVYGPSSLNTPDSEVFNSALVPGAPAPDAPIRVDGQDAWLLHTLAQRSRHGNGFVLLSFDPALPSELTLPEGLGAVSVLRVGIDLEDSLGLVAQRMDGQPGTVLLWRPDQVLAARWRRFDAQQVAQAVRRALAQGRANT